MTLRETLAKNLRRLRQDRGLTQEALADLAGVNRNYVGHIERAEYAATVDMVDKLAQALEIDAIELLRRPRKPK